MNLALWRALRHARPRSTARVSLSETSAVVDRESGRMAMFFRLDGRDEARLEALCDARRAMIREEWTRGLEPGEPSLADAEFSAHGVHWEVSIGDQAICRQKLDTVVARANRRLEGSHLRPVS
jgi:hypothetical protein